MIGSDLRCSRCGAAFSWLPGSLDDGEQKITVALALAIARAAIEHGSECPGREAP